MKITNIADINGFFEQVKKCRGNVYLHTNEGDKLNLKSKLTQYVAFSSLFNECKIKDMNLSFEYHEDIKSMLHYLMKRKGD